MTKNIIAAIVVSLFLTSCSDGGPFDRNLAVQFVKQYYQQLPYMLTYPEQNKDNIDFGGRSTMTSGGASYKIEIASIDIIETGKQTKDGKLPFKVKIKASFSRKGGYGIGPDVNNLPVDKEAIFYLGKNDFGRPKLYDEYNKYFLDSK